MKIHIMDILMGLSHMDMWIYIYIILYNYMVHFIFNIILGKFNHDLTTTSLEIMVSKGNHPQMASIQISELL